MAVMELSTLENLARDVAALPEIREKQLAQMHGLSLRDVRDIVFSEMFKDKVSTVRENLRSTGELQPLRERLLKTAEVNAASRLLAEIDNEADGTPATRITAAKTVLELNKNNQGAALLAVELSPEKFRMIFQMGRGPIAQMPENVTGN